MSFLKKSRQARLNQGPVIRNQIISGYTRGVRASKRTQPGRWQFTVFAWGVVFCLMGGFVKIGLVLKKEMGKNQNQLHQIVEGKIPEPTMAVLADSKPASVRQKLTELASVMEIQSIPPAAYLSQEITNLSDLENLIDARINNFVASGKLNIANSNSTTNTGLFNSGNGQTSAVIGGVPIVTYIPASQNVQATSLAGFGQLSSQTFSSHTINVTQTNAVNLNVSGTTALATTTISSLQVNGVNITGSGSSQWTDSGSNIYFTGGKVGVGTSNLSAALTVLGQDERTGTGTISDDGNGNITGVGTAFTTELQEGDVIIDANGNEAMVVRINSDTDLLALKNLNGDTNQTFTYKQPALNVFNPGMSRPALSVSSRGGLSSPRSRAYGAGESSFAWGDDNQASGDYSTAFGSTNAVGGNFSFVAGLGNIVTGGSAAAFGWENDIDGSYSFAAGQYNNVTGDNSVAFGQQLTVSGSYSVGIGLNNAGATLSQDNTMAILGGNVGLGTTTPGHLITLSGGAYSDGSSWANASDFNLKENFAEVKPADILQKIANLPIQQWNYKSEDTGVTHFGPTAQDFYAAFHLGGSNGQTSISTIDAPAVALLGIQALNQKLETLQSILHNLQGDLTGNLSTPSLTVSQPVVYEQTLTVLGQVYFSADNVGEAKILAGSTIVKIIFDKPYVYQPIVTITPIDFDGKWKLKAINSTGFIIELGSAQQEDVVFNWHSFVSPAARLTVSDTTSSPVELIVPATDNTTNNNSSSTPEQTQSTENVQEDSQIPDPLPEPVSEEPEILNEAPDSSSGTEPETEQPEQAATTTDSELPPTDTPQPLPQ